MNKNIENEECPCEIEPTPKLKPDTTNLIISKRNSGKSVLTRDLIRMFLSEYHFHFNWILVLSETAFVPGDYDFIPKQYRVHDFSDPLKIDLLIKRILEYQSKGRKDYEKSKKKNKEKPRGLIILDDIPLKSHGYESKHLPVLWSQGRHYFITVITSVQI